MWGRAMFLRDVNRAPIAEAGNRFATEPANRGANPVHARRNPGDDSRSALVTWFDALIRDGRCSGR
jgi:hypothetical protein